MPPVGFEPTISVGELFFRKSCILLDNAQEYYIILAYKHRCQYNMEHAHCTLGNVGHTQSVYGLFTAFPQQRILEKWAEMEWNP